MSNAEKDMRLAFERATLRQTMRHLEKLPGPVAGRLWGDARKTLDEHEALRQAEIKDYENSRAERVGTRVEELIDENGRHEAIYDMMDSSGTRKTQGQLQVQADREVWLGHANRLEAVNQKEHDALVRINREAGVLLRTKGKAVKDFKRGTDGPARTGPRH